MNKNPLAIFDKHYCLCNRFYVSNSLLSLTCTFSKYLPALIQGRWWRRRMRRRGMSLFHSYCRSADLYTNEDNFFNFWGRFYHKILPQTLRKKIISKNFRINVKRKFSRTLMSRIYAFSPDLNIL